MFEINDRTLKYNPEEIIKCTECGEEKPRFNSDNTQNYKDVKIPTMCLDCMARRRQQKKVQSVVVSTNRKNGKKKQTCLTLSERGRKILPLLAHLNEKSQSELVDKWVERALAEMPADKADHLLALVEGILDE